ATGEMGIGNTTSASVITAAITGASAEQVTGRGTGVDDATYARKVLVVRRAPCSGGARRVHRRRGGAAGRHARAGRAPRALRFASLGRARPRAGTRAPPARSLPRPRPAPRRGDGRRAVHPSGSGGRARLERDGDLQDRRSEPIGARGAAVTRRCVT